MNGGSFQPTDVVINPKQLGIRARVRVRVRVRYIFPDMITRIRSGGDKIWLDRLGSLDQVV